MTAKVKSEVAAIIFVALDVVHNIAAFMGDHTAINLSRDISARKSPDVIPEEYAM